MGTKTGISWTDATWNPIRGCSRVSEGCRHCYAERVAYRFSGEGQPYEGLVQVKKDNEGLAERLPLWNGKIKFVEEHLLDPLRWKKPRRIFVNSMSDLFHENVTDEMLDKIYAVMALCPQHTFQVLTKRPERRKEYLSKKEIEERIRAQMALLGPPNAWIEPRWPLPNVHEGISGEDQETVTKRTWILLQTPAAVRYLSLEPMLGPVDLNKGELLIDKRRFRYTLGRYLDWVIVGGESGPGARPMHPDWARSLRDQCKAAGVPFFFKQWGEWKPGDQELLFDHGIRASSIGPERVQWFQPDGRTAPCGNAPSGFTLGPANLTMRLGTKAAGCLLDGVEHHEFPTVCA